MDRGDRQVSGVPRRPHFICARLGFTPFAQKMSERRLTMIRQEKSSRGNDDARLE
jgi:hypothetical protein